MPCKKTPSPYTKEERQALVRMSYIIAAGMTIAGFVANEYQQQRALERVAVAELEEKHIPTLPTPHPL